MEEEDNNGYGLNDLYNENTSYNGNGNTELGKRKRNYEE